MSTVNDLMKYLNKTLSLILPVLPLSSVTAALTSLWSSSVKGWIDGTSPPSTVDVSLPNPIILPIAGGKVQIVEAHILITDGAAPTAHDTPQT
ncbi:MAG: hypothetical protein ACI82I_002792 [Gammaproteobacteria bacterium]|jgi:hypothetical protein